MRLSDIRYAETGTTHRFLFGEIKPGQVTHMQRVEVRLDGQDELEVIVQSEKDTEPFAIGNQVHVTVPESHLDAVREVVKVGLERLRHGGEK